MVPRDLSWRPRDGGRRPVGRPLATLEVATFPMPPLQDVGCVENVIKMLRYKVSVKVLTVMLWLYAQS